MSKDNGPEFEVVDAIVKDFRRLTYTHFVLSGKTERVFTDAVAKIITEMISAPASAGIPRAKVWRLIQQDVDAYEAWLWRHTGVSRDHH